MLRSVAVWMLIVVLAAVLFLTVDAVDQCPAARSKRDYNKDPSVNQPFSADEKARIKKCVKNCKEKGDVAGLRVCTTDGKRFIHRCKFTCASNVRQTLVECACPALQGVADAV